MVYPSMSVRTSFPDNSSYSFHRITLKLGGKLDLEVVQRILPASVAQLVRVRLVIRRLRSIPPGRQHSFVEMDHEMFSTVILSLPLIQERHLSISCERMCTILVNCLDD